MVAIVIEIIMENEAMSRDTNFLLYGHILSTLSSLIAIKWDYVTTSDQYTVSRSGLFTSRPKHSRATALDFSVFFFLY